MQHQQADQQAIDVPILSAPGIHSKQNNTLYVCTVYMMCATSDESESEHSDADDGFEYALRAKDRLEKAEYLEVCFMIMHALIVFINLTEKKTRGG